MPAEKYAPWFGVVLKCARLATKVLQLLSQESRASKLRWVVPAAAGGGSTWRSALPAQLPSCFPAPRPTQPCRSPHPLHSPRPPARLPSCRSFNDIVKRLASTEEGTPTFVSRRTESVERFVVAHGQIFINQFQNYPGACGRVGVWACGVRACGLCAQQLAAACVGSWLCSGGGKWRSGVTPARWGNAV